MTLCSFNYDVLRNAGWSSLVARRAHNPKVVGSNPTPATREIAGQGRCESTGPSVSPKSIPWAIP